MHLSTPNESILIACYDVLLHNSQQFVFSIETYIIALQQNVYEF